MKIEEYRSVENWFYNRKRPYAEGTKEVYIKYMGLFRKILDKAPDQIVHIVKVSARPIDEMENIEKQLAFAMENMDMKVRSIHQRLNALHGFWRANGTRLTPEILKQIRSRVAERIPHLALRKGKYIDRSRPLSG